MKTASLFALVVLLSAALPAMAQSPVPLACDVPATSIGGEPGTSVVIACPAGCHSGAVWGTGVYSDDSHICVSAVHAGVIDTSGGVVVVTIQPGQAEYPASTSNNITSLHWTSWGRSFSVGRYADTSSGTVAATCATTGSGIALAPGSSVRVACPAGCAAEGTVWGSGPYSDDSYVCAAGVHAGVITDAGGSFQLTMVPGQDAYAPSTQNGVTTSAWGAWGRGFTLTAAP
jgi:hypothetical protein